MAEEKMGHGGRRKGAGRPKGSVDKVNASYYEAMEIVPIIGGDGGMSDMFSIAIAFEQSGDWEKACHQWKAITRIYIGSLAQWERVKSSYAKAAAIKKKRRGDDI